MHVSPGGLGIPIKPVPNDEKSDPVPGPAQPSLTKQ